MRLLWTLRILLYIQLLLGLIRFLGPYVGFEAQRPIGDTHLLLGVIITVLAPLALAPVPNVPDTTVRRLARMAPLAPLLAGLGLRFGAIGGMAWVIIHIILGLATIALIEIAAARQRRALAA